MRLGLLIIILLLGIIAFCILFCCCSKNKSTSPIEPTEPGFYLMKDYFPLNFGDGWTWEVVSYPVEEPYIDGDQSLGEPYTDLNHDGVREVQEPYEDINANGQYDSPYDLWTPGIPYEDLNSNGQYDAYNNKWDPGEPFLDLDHNSTCSTAVNLTFYASILYPYPEDNVVTRGGQFTGVWSNGQPGGIWGDVDVYSNDESGLRWQGHKDRTDHNDLLSALPGRIVIAVDSIMVGYSVASNIPVGYIEWSSTFEAVEDVSVAAGIFKNCLRFKTVASGWFDNMEKYNGTSYQWYAKNVGLVKSEGPKESDHWLLKSAKIGNKNYP